MTSIALSKIKDIRVPQTVFSVTRKNAYEKYTNALYHDFPPVVIVLYCDYDSTYFFVCQCNLKKFFVKNSSFFLIFLGVFTKFLWIFAEAVHFLTYIFRLRPRPLSISCGSPSPSVFNIIIVRARERERVASIARQVGACLSFTRASTPTTRYRGSRPLQRGQLFLHPRPRFLDFARNDVAGGAHDVSGGATFMSC